MFTGIVTHLGVVSHLEGGADLCRITVASDMDYDTIEIGASIAHSGVCLTVVEKRRDPEGRCVVVTQAIQETLDRSNLSDLEVGSIMNLERSLRYGDEVGGHMVSGHIDGVGAVISIEATGGGHTVRIRPPLDLTRFIAEKGSVALEGVSLTVAKVHDNGDFDICVIPHTWAVTTFGGMKTGHLLNLEIDPIARYVARVLSHIQPA